MEEPIPASTKIQVHENLIEFIKSQLSANPADSKKFLMGLNGIIALVLCFVIDAVIFLIKPELASSLVSITTILIPSISGIVMVYLGAQGAVEVKANGVLQKQAQDLTSKL